MKWLLKTLVFITRENPSKKITSFVFQKLLTVKLLGSRPRRSGQLAGVGGQARRDAACRSHSPPTIISVVSFNRCFSNNKFFYATNLYVLSFPVGIAAVWSWLEWRDDPSHNFLLLLLLLAFYIIISVVIFFMPSRE